MSTLPSRIRPLSSTIAWLALIVAVGLVLRVAWVLYVEPVPISDQGWYYHVAENLARGKGFVLHLPPDLPQDTAYRPPAYPFLLAGLWKAVGIGPTPAKLMNAVLGALTIPFVFAIGRQVFDRRVGLISASIYALLPSAIVWLALTLSEALFTLIFVVALWFILAFRPRSTAQWALGAAVVGLLTGLGALTRGQGVLLLPVALLVWLARDGLISSLRQAGLALIVAALVITPWTVRNWVVMDAPILVASNTGVNLRIGHAPDANGTFSWINDPIDGVPASRVLFRTDWEVRSYEVYPGRALDYALANPWREVTLAKDKVYHTYESESWMVSALTYLGKPLDPAVERSLTPLLEVSWYLILFPALVTAPLWFGRQPNRFLPVAVIVLWTLFHILFFGLARFHLPLLPLFVIGAVGGTQTAFTSARSWLERRTWRRLSRLR